MRAQVKKRNEYFNPVRFFLLFKRDFFTNYHSIIISIAAIAGFVIFSSAISTLNQNRGDFHLKLYFMLLYIGGFIVTSRVFKELHNTQKSYTYVTLPGSLLEKFTERWITSSIGYALGALLVYSMSAAISEIINRLLFGYGHTLFSPLSRTYLIGVAAYVVIQSVFLAGSVFFKKNPLIKTILMLTVLAIVLSMIAGLIVRFFFWNRFISVQQSRQVFNSLHDLSDWMGMTEADLQLIGRSLWLGIRIFFWALLAPLCLIISYLKFKKIEV
jgi:hypothetical protein